MPRSHTVLAVIVVVVAAFATMRACSDEHPDEVAKEWFAEFRRAVASQDLDAVGEVTVPHPQNDISEHQWRGFARLLTDSKIVGSRMVRAVVLKSEDGTKTLRWPDDTGGWKAQLLLLGYRRVGSEEVLECVLQTADGERYRFLLAQVDARWKLDVASSMRLEYAQPKSVLEFKQQPLHHASNYIDNSFTFGHRNGVLIVYLSGDVHDGGPRIVALTAGCTNPKCDGWNVEIVEHRSFVCRLCDSTFARTGVLTGGPATKSLARLGVTKGELLKVSIDKRRRFRFEAGEWGDPESFVPTGPGGRPELEEAMARARRQCEAIHESVVEWMERQQSKKPPESLREAGLAAMDPWWSLIWIEAGPDTASGFRIRSRGGDGVPGSIDDICYPPLPDK